jgi:microcystin degradation protein MlrC
MNNQNVADISAFENLQAGQHAKADVSQMSIFNAFTAADVTKITQEMKNLAKIAINARKAAGKLHQKVEEMQRKATAEEAELFNSAFHAAAKAVEVAAYAGSASFF